MTQNDPKWHYKTVPFLCLKGGVVVALSELKIKNLKPRDKRYLVSDGQGLYIAVMPTGEKYWYHRTWENGHEHKRSLGRYPDVSLKEARELKYKPQAQPGAKPELFGPVLEDWFKSRYMPSCSEKRAKETRSVINRFVSPALSTRPLKEITPREVFELVNPINEKSTFVGHHVKSIITAVFKYAVATGLCEWNPAAQISGALAPHRSERHFSTVQNEAQARALMQSIYASKCKPVFRIALLLLAHTFVRPGEIRFAEWNEIDFASSEWRIPAEKMKMKRPHIVPLSPQSVSLFQELRGMVMHPVYCFVLPFNDNPIGSVSLNQVMYRLDYDGKATPHSFRGMASTLLNEHGFPSDVIERQLAHAETNAVRAAYNRAEYMDERRKMMNWWSDYLDSLIK